MGTGKENFIGVGVGVGIGIDKTNGKSTPIPIPTPTPMKGWGHGDKIDPDSDTDPDPDEGLKGEWGQGKRILSASGSGSVSVKPTGGSAGTRFMAAPSSIVIVNRLFLFSVDESGRRERITISFGRSLLSPLANRRFASSPIALPIGLRRGHRSEAERRGASHFAVASEARHRFQEARTRKKRRRAEYRLPPHSKTLPPERWPAAGDWVRGRC